MEERHKTVVWLAKELAYSRTNVYKIYDKSSIDTDVLLRISIILEYDFFKIYSDEVESKVDWKLEKLFTVSLISLHVN